MSSNEDPSHMSLRVALHGGPAWVEWARNTIARACEVHCLDIEVAPLPESLTPAAIDAAGTSSHIVLLLEGPTQMVARRAIDSTFAEALRSAISTTASACELARRYGAKAIEVDTSDVPPTYALLSLLGIRHCEENADLLVEAPDAGSPALPPDASPDTIDGCLAPLLHGAQLKVPLSLRWPREVFISGDQPGMPLPVTIEIAGGARVLSYGPYFPLPTGKWRVVPMIGFSRQVGRMPFLIEVVCESIIHRAYFEAQHAGIYSMPFELELNSDRMGIPVEIRLVIQDAALEGAIALIEVGLEASALAV